MHNQPTLYKTQRKAKPGLEPFQTPPTGKFGENNQTILLNEKTTQQMKSWSH